MIATQGDEVFSRGFPLSRKFYVGYARVFDWLYLRKQEIVRMACVQRKS